MAKCVYCGESAGIFKDHHPECKQVNAEGWDKMVSLSRDSMIGTGNVGTLPIKLSEIAKSSHIPEHQCRSALVSGWDQALGHFLDDSTLSESEQERLISVATELGLTPEELNTVGAFDRAVKAKLITDLVEDRVPTGKVNGQLPFNLKKSEQPVYLFHSVNYFEERTRTTYVGGSQGVSLRIMSGVYYRIGGFKGAPVKTSQMEFVDSGLFLATTAHLYFKGDRKSFRIPYAKIVSFVHYSDGIGVHRDLASARPQVFVTGDGWFTCNLVENLARLAEGR